MKRNFVSGLHNSTARNYLSRMMDDKVSCMKEAKKYKKNYWDGKRRYGYGGYKYIPDRWKNVAKKLIKIYKLKSDSKIFLIIRQEENLIFKLMISFMKTLTFESVSSFNFLASLIFSI